MTATNMRWNRGYINGVDVSGVVRDLGGFGAKFDAPMNVALSDGVMNTVLGHADITAGPLNAFLSPGTIDGTYEAMVSAQQTLHYMRVWGIGAEPVAGDPIAAWVFAQSGFQHEPTAGFDVYTLPAMQAAPSQPSGYANPFGVLTHPNSTETAVNTAISTIDGLAATAKGGIFWWQILSSDGTVTVSLDDSATNANNAAFAALSGATSGSQDASITPQYGYAILSTTAAVRRWLRSQVAFGTATTVTFISGFCRAY